MDNRMDKQLKINSEESLTETQMVLVFPIIFSMINSSIRGKVRIFNCKEGITNQLTLGIGFIFATFGVFCSHLNVVTGLVESSDYRYQILNEHFKNPRQEGHSIITTVTLR